MPTKKPNDFDRAGKTGSNAFHENDPRVQEAVDAYEEHGSQRKAAAELGVPRQTFITRLKHGQKFGYRPNAAKDVELPVFPDDDIPAEDILDHMEKRFEQRLEHDNALNWFEIKINDPKPMGLTFVGDPHLGSNGCNIPLLRSDVEIMSSTPGVRAVNLGDTADNWSYGYLIKLYAENDVSRQTERRLARWFLEDAGIPWLVWLMGNHDAMAEGFGIYLKTLNAKRIPMVDWRAKFKLIFPNGREVKVDAAHNHKGTSIYNPLHGQKRAALWNEDADITVAGHHHNWALTQEELEDGRVVQLARARGYKWLDDHATTNGFTRKNHGASIMFIINPEAESETDFIQPYANLKRGADYLTYLREGE